MKFSCLLQTLMSSVISNSFLAVMQSPEARRVKEPADSRGPHTTEFSSVRCLSSELAKGLSKGRRACEGTEQKSIR